MDVTFIYLNFNIRTRAGVSVSMSVFFSSRASRPVR
jgi:hypothetical protein